MIITIEDKEITLKHSFRSHLVYENITGHSFAPKGITDVVTFFYCSVMAADIDLALTFDKFIDWLAQQSDSDRYQLMTPGYDRSYFQYSEIQHQ